MVGRGVTFGSCGVLNVADFSNRGYKASSIVIATVLPVRGWRIEKDNSVAPSWSFFVVIILLFWKVTSVVAVPASFKEGRGLGRQIILISSFPSVPREALVVDSAVTLIYDG